MKSLLTFFFLLLAYTLYAEGSKDLYPRDVKGIRAFLVSGRGHFEGRIEQGTHYVWAKSGETIGVASSAQNIRNGRITVISPTGTVYQTEANNIGRIYANNGRTTREAELAGPGIGYTPYEIEVTEEGIWEVIFTSPNNLQTGEPADNRANADWAQPDNAFIAAWDISVRPTTVPQGWITGRVFTNLLYMYVSGITMDYPNGTGGYYGKNFVLTNDGFLYRADANGNHGLGFLYFANNKGFSDTDGVPSYKSVNQDKENFHLPYLPDTEHVVTHKLFYNVPDKDLPTQASGRYPGVDTWLLKQPDNIEIKDIRLIGYEGRENHLSKRGAWIEFETSYPGRYQFEISSTTTGYSFPSKKFIHEATAGWNRVYWDGTDADGKLLPEGKNYPIDMHIGLLAGEVHFPFLDVELNPNGLLLENYSLTGENLGYATVYWDDSDIIPMRPSSYGRPDPLTNLTGIRSDINGHKWGLYNASISTLSYFGDGKGMDTWTYQVDVKFTEQKNITVNVHDLSIPAIFPDKEAVWLNENYSYTVIVKNDGPSDAIDAAFTFETPIGVSIQSAQMQNSCGTSVSESLTDNRFTSKLNLENGCELIFIFDVSAHTPSEELYNSIPVQASIVRAPDTTDPDATTEDINRTYPGTAVEECQPQCNNIRWNYNAVLLDPLEKNAKIGLKKSVTYEDSDQSETVSVGDNLIYHFEIKNLGDVLLKNIVVTDDLLTQDPIWNTPELLPDETHSIQYRYVLKHEDTDKTIYNSAVVQALTPRNRPVRDISGTEFDNDDPTVFRSSELPKIHLKKSVNNHGSGENGQFTLGDTIVYRFEIKHEGIEPVHGAKLIDSMISDQDILLGDLNPDGISTHFEDFIIDEEILRSGKVINSATVTAKTATHNLVVKDISGHTFDDDNPTETLLATPHITLDDHFETFQNEQISFDFLENDTRGTSTLKEVIFLDDFQYGSLTKISGRYQYTPFPDIKDVVETVRYTLLDNSKLKSNISTLTIHIYKTEAIAVDDSFKTGYNFVRTLRLLDNDYAQGSKINPSSIIIHKPAENGTVRVRTNGTVEYIPNHLFTGTDFFEYQVADLNGNFSAPARVIIEVKGFVIPNIITPNDDNVNDAFFIIGANSFDKIELQVRDRFGIEIFSSTDYKNDWIPTEDIADGTYYYVLKFHKKSHKPAVRKGHILIVRSRYNM